MQQYMVDQLKAEAKKLSWLRERQRLLEVSGYSGLREFLGDSSSMKIKTMVGHVGRPFILLLTHLGGNGYMHQG